MQSIHILMLKKQNIVILKERLIEKVITGKYADHDNTNEMTARRSYTSKGRHKKITSTQLAENWCIGFEELKLQSTQQLRIQQDRQYFLSVGDIDQIETITLRNLIASSQLILSMVK